MKGDLRCVEGRLWRHDPQQDDPDLETDIGQCPDCSGDGCGDDGEPVSKPGRSFTWFCEECQALSYVVREHGEMPCPLCQPDAYEEQLRDTYLGY